MLWITAESGKYPDGRIPDLENDGDAFAYCIEAISKLLPANREEEVMGILVTWSADSWKHGPYATWQDAVTAAAESKKRDVAPKTESAMQREEKLSTTEVTGLEKGVGSTGDVEDKKIVFRDESRKFANCGQAAFRILEELRVVKAVLVKENALRFKTGQDELVRKVLMGVPDKANTVLLIDCQFPQVHDFLIEVHPDGRRYLAQGYQGTYFAAWWLGINEDRFSGTPSGPMLDLRARFGLGKPIAGYEDLVAMICPAAAPKSWTDLAKLWPQLPFNPDKQETDGIAHRGGAPDFLIEVFTLTDAAGAYSALNGKGTQSISELAVRHATET